MKKDYKTAGAFAVLFGLAVMAISPLTPGPWPFPDDGSGGNVAQHLTPGPWPFPDDGSGGNLTPGPWPFPDDGSGGNLV